MLSSSIHHIIPQKLTSDIRILPWSLWIFFYIFKGPLGCLTLTMTWTWTLWDQVPMAWQTMTHLNLMAMKPLSWTPTTLTPHLLTPCLWIPCLLIHNSPSHQLHRSLWKLKSTHAQPIINICSREPLTSLCLQVTTHFLPNHLDSPHHFETIHFLMYS